MGTTNKRQVVIPREKSVFWMDKNGNWCNEHGRFEHPRIIKYFNKSIKKDETGYFVYQNTDEFEEKVYFPYEDTALFVIDLKISTTVTLALNTGRVVNLTPERLFSRDDSLYTQDGDDMIKFTSKAMLKLAKNIKEEGDQLYLCIDNRQWKIR